MLRMNNFVDGDPNGSMNMMSTPEDSPNNSPTNSGRKESLTGKNNPVVGKFDPVAQSEAVPNGRISDLHSQLKAN